MARRRYLGGIVRGWACPIGICVALWLGVALTAVRAVADQADAAPARLRERTWENYYGVAILPPDRAIIVGDKGVVMTSNDRGQTWTRRQLSKANRLYDLYSIAFAPGGKRGWIVGDGGAVFRSDDGGVTWTMQESGQTVALLKFAAVNPDTGCTVGEHGTVLCTDDGGARWHLQKFEDLVFFDVAFTDPQDGWAVGEFATAVHTADGGKTWRVQTGAQRNISADPYFAIAFASPSDGLVLGLNGVDMVSSDGGKNWKAGMLPGDTRSIFSAVSKPGGSNELYLGGADGLLGSVQNGALVMAPSAVANSITSVAMSANYSLAVGVSGTVLRSEDVGQHWTSATEVAKPQTRAQ
jgi:photosystem II stability/assembly factor-like uncharacterized protein